MLSGLSAIAGRRRNYVKFSPTKLMMPPCGHMLPRRLATLATAPWSGCCEIFCGTSRHRNSGNPVPTRSMSWAPRLDSACAAGWVLAFSPLRRRRRPALRLGIALRGKPDAAARLQHARCDHYLCHHMLVSPRRMGTATMIAEEDDSMRRATIIAACFSALLVSVAAAPAFAGYGAVAFDEKTAKYGFGWNEDTQKRADEAAIQACNSEACKVVIPVPPRKCAAFATAEEGQRLGWQRRCGARQSQAPRARELPEKHLGQVRPARERLHR